MWRTSISTAAEQLLDEGKQVELFAGEGLLILQRDPAGVLHLSWLDDAEARSAYLLRQPGDRMA